MSETPRFRLYGPPALEKQSLILGWSQDGGNLGARVTDCLNAQLKTTEVGDIEPLGFFSFAGVRIEDNIIQSPESKLYACAEKNLLVLKSSAPEYEHYRFLNTILDLTQQYSELNEFYTVGGMISLLPHTAPRGMSAVVNRHELKDRVTGFELQLNTSYQTPLGGRPTLSSFLSWIAKRRSIDGVSLWTEVPFYIAAVDDWRAVRRTLLFLNQRFELGLDFSQVDLQLNRQNEKIDQLRERNPEIGKCIGMLERGIMLSAEENERLTKQMTQFLGEED